MTQINLTNNKICLKDEVECFYDKTITRFGNSAKIDAQKKYIGRKAIVIILKD